LLEDDEEPPEDCDDESDDELDCDDLCDDELFFESFDDDDDCFEELAEFRADWPGERPLRALPAACFPGTVICFNACCTHFCRSLRTRCSAGAPLFPPPVEPAWDESFDDAWPLDELWAVHPSPELSDVARAAEIG